jgi:hypothetical protein
VVRNENGELGRAARDIITRELRQSRITHSCSYARKVADSVMQFMGEGYSGENFSAGLHTYTLRRGGDR